MDINSGTHRVCSSVLDALQKSGFIMGRIFCRVTGWFTSIRMRRVPDHATAFSKRIGAENRLCTAYQKSNNHTEPKTFIPIQKNFQNLTIVN
jgi:hypothetical protein